jgi:hypothetical protein
MPSPPNMSPSTSSQRLREFPSLVVVLKYHSILNVCRNGKADKRALEKIAREQLQGTPTAAPAPAIEVVPATPVIPPPTEHVVSKNHAQPALLAPPTSSGLKPLRLAANFAAPISVPPITVHTAMTPALPAGLVPHQDWNKSTATVGTTKSNAPTLVGVPLEKDIEPSKLEGQTSIWAGYEQDVMPQKDQARWVRNFRHQIFYLYRRLFSIVFLANFGLFIWFAIKGANTMQVANAVVSNLTVAVLMRQDYVVDAFFVFFTAVPRSWPMWIRRVCARVYHIGGLHSGAGVSGALWLILFCAKATQEYIRKQGVSAICSSSHKCKTANHIIRFRALPSASPTPS